jgi:hypothetical protein
MAIDKYMNLGKSRHTPGTSTHQTNGGGHSGKPSTLIVEANRSLSVWTDGKEHPLGISPPRDPAGGVLCIEVENIPAPAIAQIRRVDGQTVCHGDRLSADELASLVYVSRHNAIPDTPPAFAYSVSSTDGDHGRQILRFRLVQTSAATILIAPDRM